MTSDVLRRSYVRPHGALHVTLWVLQIVLAALFVMAGGMKLFTPYDDLAAKMAWVRDVPAWLPRFIGFCELAGAAGLILPAVTRIKPVLTACAAASLAIVMALAFGFHLSRGEWSSAPIPLVLGLLCTFVAWGRFGRARLPDRAAA
jgi:putative oxidoreductase